MCASSLGESYVARSDLLRAEIYPDSDDTAFDDGDDAAYDRIEFTYNRQGEQKSKKDQNGTIRGFWHDKLGRLEHDYVDTLGQGVDGRVRRITRSYGVGSRPESITSYTMPCPRTGDVVDQVAMVYDAHGLLCAEFQSHSGPVDMLTTPFVQYAYDATLADGELVKGLRPTKLIYPNGRIVRYEYADAGSSSSSSGAGESDLDDALNRVKFIADDTAGEVGTHLAEYARLGLGSFVQVDYTEPQIRYDLAHGSGIDPYAGLDRFGRVIDLVWRNYATGEDVVRIRHGYDRAGNRLYREDPVAAAHGVDLDEVYTYDGLYQLKTFIRGALNAQKTAIASPTFRQAWDFDSTGNWARFREDEDGDGRWDLDQTRHHNAANELTAFESKIGDLWISPSHDRNGNMIRIPQPKDPTKQFTLRYDAWNRLVKVSDATGSVADYHYDGRNFRTVKQVHRDPADPIPGEEAAERYPETRHFYYNASWQCLEERLETSSTGLSPTADRQFVWGLRYIDDLLLRDRDTQPGGDLGRVDSGLDERLYALQDANWNVVAIADIVGTIAERYLYAAFGKTTFLTPTVGSRDSGAHAWDTLYTGRVLDLQTGLYYYRARYYAVNLGRFVARDPIRYEGRDGNLFRYVKNTPAIASDPTGMLPPDGFPFTPELDPTLPDDLFRKDAPFPAAPGGKSAMIPNKRGNHGPWCCWFGDCKTSRLKPIPGVTTGGPNATSPTGGNHIFYRPPYTQPRIGGGGATPCIIVVIHCAGGIAVFHFAAGDDPDDTIEAYRWPRGCHAIVCGGDDNRDSQQSNCIAEDAISSIEAAGIPLVGVSASDACGWEVGTNNQAGHWYQSNRQEWSTGPVTIPGTTEE